MSATDPNDRERLLVQRSQRGDRSAQQELVGLYLPGLIAWVRLKRSDLVERREATVDLVQTVFRMALGDLDRFEYRGANSFRNWLLTYAENKLRNLHQFWGAERRRPDREVAEPLSQLYHSVTPSRAASAQEAIERFEAGFAQLGEADRDVIMLVAIEGHSHAEAAERLGISATASRKAFERAKVRLAALLAARVPARPSDSET